MAKEKKEQNEFVAPKVSAGAFKDANIEAIVKAITAAPDHLGFASGDTLEVVAAKGKTVVLHGDISGHRKVTL